jgi:hypothetical protein
VRRPSSSVDADARVKPLLSSTTCTNTWRAERVTTRRGRSAVPSIFLRRRVPASAGSSLALFPSSETHGYLPLFPALRRTISPA